MFNVRNYSEASAFLGHRNSRKLGHETWVNWEDEKTISVRYHQTNIITYHSDGRVDLSNGGWYTVTTKRKMNDHTAFNIWGQCDTRSFDSDGVWEISTGQDAARFDDDGRVSIEIGGSLQAHKSNWDA